MDVRLISCLIFSLAFGLSLQLDGDNPTTSNDANSTIANQTEICRLCICKDSKVDCSEQELTTFFTVEQWTVLADVKPIEVDLSRNLFVNITTMSLLPIEVLNLSRCNIEWIMSGSFRDLQKMRVLDLSHNNLTSAKLSPHAFEGRYSPEKFEPLSSMRVLNLAYNDLHSLHQDLFEHLSDLTELDLSGNPLMTIDHVTLIAISSLPMLKILRMRSCQLDEIPDKFLHTPRYLERLDISDNKLVSVPQELEETKNLIYLNLNQNPIEMLNMSSPRNLGFPLLENLEELHMCHMEGLRSIGRGALGGLTKLRRLHISFNPMLTHIDPKALTRPDENGEYDDWSPVKELYLQSNALTEIDSRLLAHWDVLDAIDVSDNPFLCDCSTQWMVDILVKIIDTKKANASATMVCQEPVEMRGLTMQHLHNTYRKMRCVDKYGHRPEKDGSILLGTLIGVLLAVPIMLALMLLWRRGYFAWIGLRGPQDLPRTFYKRAPAEDFNL